MAGNGEGGGVGWQEMMMGGYEMVERGGGVVGNHGGRKGMVDREGMVGIEGGEDIYEQNTYRT